MSQVILLNSIWGSDTSRSLGPYLLRHVIEKRGYTCQVIDHCQEFKIEELVELVEHFIDNQTICIGISTTFFADPKLIKRGPDQSAPPEIFLQLMRYIKKKYSKIKIILGGAGVRYITRGEEDVDAFMLGDSEDLFPELLDHWTKNTDPPSSIKWYNTEKNVYNVPLNKTYEISMCDFQWSERDCIIQGEVLPIEVSRGCIFKCKFCGYPHLGKKKFDYLRDTNQIREHMIRNYNIWGVTNYIIVDDTFNDTEIKVNNFLEMSKSLPFKLNFWAYIRADLCHRFEGMAEKLYESGLRAATFGIETIGKKASLLIGKGWCGVHARDYVPKLIHEIWKDDVNVLISIIVGLPGDTVETCEMTRQWIDDANLSATFTGLHIASDSKSHLMPFLSEFEKNAELHGFIKGPNSTWKSADWTSESAQQLAQEFVNKRKIRRLHSMLHIISRTYGIPHSEVINKDLDTVNFSKIPRYAKLINDYIVSYKKKLLELK